MTHWPPNWHNIDFYTIAFTLRSGSNLLCDYLSANGLGFPSEYFQYPFGLANKFWYDLCGVPEHQFVLFLDALISLQSQNNIFGSKIAWDQKNALNEQLTKITANSCVTITNVFPNNKWIYLRREDKIDQALSLWRAVKTDVWTSSTENRAAEPAYNFFRILSCLIPILVEECAWSHFFATNAIIPLIVTYEGLTNDPISTIYNIYAYIKPKHRLQKDKITLSTDLQIQRDQRSTPMKDRFVEDLYRIGAQDHWASRNKQLPRWIAFFRNEEWRDLAGAETPVAT